MLALLAPAAAQQPLPHGPTSVAPVAEKLIDAVVNISTSQTVKGPEGAPLPRVPKGAPFEEFFEDFFNRKGGTLAVRPQGVLARLRLRRRRQGRPRRHQQSRHRRRRRDHRQLQRRHQAQGRQGPGQGHQDRSGPPQGDAEEAAARRCPSARRNRLQGRRLGDGDRQPVRPRRLGDGRHHLGQAARHQFRPLRRLPADRRRHQQGQLRRPAVQHGRRGDRREHGHHLADRRLDRHRLLPCPPIPPWW